MVPMNVEDWSTPISLTGEEARAWLDEYARPEHVEICAGIEDGLSLTRTRRTAEAGSVLRTAGDRLAALRASRPSIVHILKRWYHAATAYYLFSVNDLDAAGRDLDAADRAVGEAVSLDRFLISFAHHCPEFHLHHARVARNRRNFSEMQRLVDLVRAQAANQAPLCELADGTKVDYAAIARYYAALPLQGDRARAAVSVFSQDAERRALFDRFVLELYLLPGMVMLTPPGYGERAR